MPPPLGRQHHFHCWRKKRKPELMRRRLQEGRGGVHKGWFAEVVSGAMFFVRIIKRAETSKTGTIAKATKTATATRRATTAKTAKTAKRAKTSQTAKTSKTTKTAKKSQNSQHSQHSQHSQQSQHQQHNSETPRTHFHSTTRMSAQVSTAPSPMRGHPKSLHLSPHLAAHLVFPSPSVSVAAAEGACSANGWVCVLLYRAWDSHPASKQTTFRASHGTGVKGKGKRVDH